VDWLAANVYLCLSSAIAAAGTDESLTPQIYRTRLRNMVTLFCQ